MEDPKTKLIFEINPWREFLYIKRINLPCSGEANIKIQYCHQNNAIKNDKKKTAHRNG
jgi:hypothetical protein